MSEKETFGSKQRKNKKTIWIIAIILIVLLAGLFVGFFVYEEKEKISTEFINATLAKASELTTAKLRYTGMTEYIDEGIPVINKSNFVMVYKATVRAGIDVSDIKTKVDNEERIVWLTIPDAEIQEVKVDPASIKYYDENFSLFNLDEKEDGNKAQVLAEQAAFEEASNMGILELADQQSETLIKGILEDAIPKDYELRVKNQ